jgi:hypothetical protein
MNINDFILPSGHSSQYLNDYKDGKIKKGLGIDCELDNYIRFKRKQMNIILGHDNSGKSYWSEWYFLALSTHHDLKWTLWMGENSSGQVMRDLIQMYSGKYFNDLSYSEIRKYEMKMEHWFTFVDNKHLYTPDQLLDILSSINSDGCFIDPFTGLDRGMSHSDNYEFLNKTRLFCNQQDKTVYISTHPNSESGRSGMIYPQDHQWFGHLKPPLKAHIEGGKPFLNRCDDMITVHRLVKHPTMKYMTMIDVEKVKDRDTGGQNTDLNIPLLFDFNKGLGFTMGGIDAIKRVKREPKKDEDIFTGSPLSRPNPMPQEIQNFYEVLDKEDDFKPMDDDCPF